jgi:hypothetical protein
MYAGHRLRRNASQKTKLSELGAAGITVDHILEQLERGIRGFADPRNNISILSRPPLHVHSLIDIIQQKLLSVAPSECFHTHCVLTSLI